MPIGSFPNKIGCPGFVNSMRKDYSAMLARKKTLIR
jgi:hypothetical protein